MSIRWTRTIRLALAAACGGGDPSASTARATCGRRGERGDLAGLSVEERTAREEAYFATLGGQRAGCAAAWDTCLEGPICDDFRECHANIGRDVCGCPDLRMAILAPTDGQSIGPADDADPSDPQLQYDFVIECNCLEDFEQVELRLVEPVESSYGFGLPDDRGVATIRVPLMPGTNRLFARGMRTAVRSSDIVIDVAP